MANGINAPFGLSPYISNVGKADITKMTPYNIPYQFDEDGNIITWKQNIFAGDPVAFSGMGTAPMPNDSAPDAGVFVGTAGSIVNLNAYNPNRGLQGANSSVFASNATAQIVGVGISAKYNNPNNIYSTEYPFWAASSPIMIDVAPVMYVNDDPEALFTVQCSTSTNNIKDAVFTWDMIGQNVQLNVGGKEFQPYEPFEEGVKFIAANNPASGNVLTGNSAYYADLSTIARNNGKVVTTNAIANITDPELEEGIPLIPNQTNYRANFKILGVVLPTSVYNVGNQNSINSQIISKLVIGETMPFVTVFGKINNHVYGCPSYSTVTVGNQEE